MSRFIICTVGRSLLTNKERPWAPWERGSPLPASEDVSRWLRQADPVKASAETNTLRALDLSELDRLALLYSDTTEGRFCAEALKGYYSGKVAAVSVHKIVALGYSHSKFTTGLKGLVDTTLKLVREADRNQWQRILCATGGFKPEAAFLTLLGALLRIEVVYLHEEHRELVALPPLPLTWDAQFVSHHQGFFRWIEEDFRRSEEVESRLKAAPELRFLVEDDGDGHTTLNAAGNLLFKAAQERLNTGPRATWPEAAPRLPEEKNQVSLVGHHRPKGWEAFVKRLCHIDCVSLVRYDETARGGPRVKVLDAEHGVVGVRFGEPRCDLPLRLETTARTAEQCELVADYFRSIIVR